MDFSKLVQGSQSSLRDDSILRTTTNDSVDGRSPNASDVKGKESKGWKDKRSCSIDCLRAAFPMSRLPDTIVVVLLGWYPNSLPLGRAKWKADSRNFSSLVAKCGFHLDKRGGMRQSSTKPAINQACHPPCADGGTSSPPDK